MKVEYVNYKRRALQGSVKVLYVSIVFVFLLFLNDIGKMGLLFVFSIYLFFSIVYVYLVFKRSRYYLTEINFEGENCKFTIYEYDQKIEVIQTVLAETRIKIWEKILPFTKYGRNYILIVEQKKGYKYERIIQQYELGKWDIEVFKKVIKEYGEIKELPMSSDLQNRI
jgi:hypothetical protein